MKKRKTVKTASKKKAKKTVRKRPAAWSASKKTGGKTGGVDAYMKKLDPDMRALVAALRAVVKKAAPGIEEALKWSTPVYSKNGLVCWLHAARAHAAIGFYQGASLTDPRGYLEGEGKRLRHMKVRSSQDVRPAVVAGWVRQAVKLNAK